MGRDRPVELHRACPNPGCDGRVPVDAQECPKCGANYVAAKIENEDRETRKNRSGRAGGKQLGARAVARNTLVAGVVALVAAVTLFVVREKHGNPNLIVVLLISGVAGIVGGLKMLSLAKRQEARWEAREAKRRA